jgi:integrase
MKNLERGIALRHTRACPANQEKRCTCLPTYRVQVRIKGKSVTRTFDTLRASRAFRDDTERRIKLNLRLPDNDTIGQALVRLRDDLINGTAMTRSGEDFKPSTARSYCESIDLYLLPALGGAFTNVRTGELSPVHITAIRDELRRRTSPRSGQPLTGSTVRNAFMPLHVVVRREAERGALERNPFLGVILPAVRSKEREAVTPATARMLLSALEIPDRAFYATAIFSGLRSGEISGLNWGDIDFWNKEIRVSRAFDQKTNQTTDPKTKNAKRIVPLLPDLEEVLLEYQAQSAANDGAERIAGITPIFLATSGRRLRGAVVTARAKSAWSRHGMLPVGLHSSRHTFATMAISAGVGLYELSRTLGHASTSLTSDVYGHLYPDSRTTVRDRMSAYLDSSL